MGFFAATKRCLLKWNTFSGRASRSEFWWWFLVLVILVSGLIATVQFFAGLFLVLIALWLPVALAVGSRRLHDMDCSGRWILVPICLISAGLLFLFVGTNLAFGGPRYETASGIVFFSGLACVAAAICSSVFLARAGTLGANRHGDAPSA